MATVNELTRIGQWITTVLESDATLMSVVSDVVDTFIPSDAVYPIVVFEFAAPVGDTDGNFGSRIWARERFSVKAIAKSRSFLSVQTAADRIDALLQARSGGAADIVINYCKRTEPIKYPEGPIDKDVWYVHLGGVYEIAASYAG